MSDTRDKWANWLLAHRHDGDEDRLKQMLEWLVPVRAKVLENCALAGDETLLDIGCGDGLIGFGALDQLDAGKVIFSDISQDLLTQVEQLAHEMQVADRCEFVRADVTTLASIADHSVDAITLRSVLIYVADKLSAFKSIHRVLKPDGVVSFFEPIHRFRHLSHDSSMWGYDVSPIMEITDKVKAVFNAIQPIDTDPMLNFDERDLIKLMEQAGFNEIHLELRTEIVPLHQYGDGDWEQFIHVAGNPKIPTLSEAMEQVLTPLEIQQMTDYLRPKVEAGDGTLRNAIVYIWAVK